MVRATAADGFVFTEDDITITRNSDKGVLTKGSSVDDGNFVPVYEGKDGEAVLTGWIFKMPQGGVKVTVDFKADESKKLVLALVQDENGNSLLGSGYISIQHNGNNKTDLSADLGTAPVGTAVTVSLTDTGKSLYTLTNVTVDGVTCKKGSGYFGFYMPSSDANISVYLTAKAPEPTAYKIYSSSDYNKGTVGFYIDGNPVDSATKDDTVDITFAPVAGYMLESYTIVRKTDNVTVKEESKEGGLSDGTYTVSIPVADVMDDFTVTAKFVNKTFKAKIKLVDKDGNAITDENIIQFKGTDGKYKAVKNDSEVEVVFDKNMNISLTATGKTYKITKYTITDTNGVEKATEGSCTEFNFKAAKDGVKEITVRLEVK